MPSDPVIQLPSVDGQPGRIIDNCKWMIRKFVEHDAYVAYDYWAGYRQPPTDVINWNHIYSINSAMMARSSRKAWERFVGSELQELQSVPRDLNLIDSSDAELEPSLDAVRRLVERISCEKWLTEMAASKVLHLLRPSFIAISGNYVRQSLRISPEAWKGLTSKTKICAERMIAVQRGASRLGLANASALSQLHDFANSLPPVVPIKEPLRGQQVPVRLSKVRILDIILWVDEATGANHQGWQELRKQNTET